jgi:hypothetical protein
LDPDDEDEESDMLPMECDAESTREYCPLPPPYMLLAPKPELDPDPEPANTESPR